MDLMHRDGWQLGGMQSAYLNVLCTAQCMHSYHYKCNS
jgi:hypothetical protein